ncbi:MAG: hypothetical protein JWN52_5080 [Actinomycetia bacterium]|nr:hypothetical protein [Actinomycetes bacterium]
MGDRKPPAGAARAIWVVLIAERGRPGRSESRTLGRLTREEENLGTMQADELRGALVDRIATSHEALGLVMSAEVEKALRDRTPAPLHWRHLP